MKAKLLKTLAPTLMVVCSLFSIVACDDSEGAYVPTYYGFSYSPSTVHAGDSVTICAVQQKKGHYLNKCTYSWSMRLSIVDSLDNTVDSTLTYSQSTNYDGTYNGDPTWKVKIPEGTVSRSTSVSFSARWSNSADGNGSYTTSTGGNGTTGSITATTYVLYSNASGSFTLPIAQ